VQQAAGCRYIVIIYSNAVVHFLTNLLVYRNIGMPKRILSLKTSEHLPTIMYLEEVKPC
jgi:hypothetical protein